MFTTIRTTEQGHAFSSEGYRSLSVTVLALPDHVPEAVSVAGQRSATPHLAYGSSPHVHGYHAAFLMI